MHLCGIFYYITLIMCEDGMLDSNCNNTETAKNKTINKITVGLVTCYVILYTQQIIISIKY